MKKVLLFAAACLLCGALPVSGASILLQFMSTGMNRILTDANGVPLADGSLIRIGTFTDGLMGNRTLLETGSFADLDAIFTPLAESVAGAGSATLPPPLVPPPTPNILVVNGAANLMTPGASVGSIGMITSPPMQLGAGTQLFVWVLGTRDLGAAAGAPMGIFASSTQPDWKFKTGATETNVLRGDATDLEAIRGNVAAGQLMIVPEPSAAFLAGIFGMLALWIRRRNG